jgi:putative MATE family efflux protein
MAVLVDRSVPRTLFSMAYPMLAGTFAMNAYNLTDTWFVSRLGTLPLAAMGFTFPVVMLLTCVAMGIGSGVTALASHAMGRNDSKDAARFVTHGMMLTMGVTAAISVGGYALIDPVFTALGADAETLPLVGQYMRTWYLGAVFMTMPMLGNGILISAGDSRAASGFMILGTVLNVILDPIMIFGYVGCPAMGIRGAALATVIAQGVSTVWLFRLLLRKHRLLVRGVPRAVELLASLRSIARFAVPNILSMALMPISATVITRILSGFGTEVVAATAAAGRVEMFAFMVPMALGMSLTPFVSQNFGAGRVDRIREARNVSTGFAIGYGGLMAAAFFACAPWLAAAFTDDAKVAETFVSYVRIVAFGYGMMEVHRYCGFFLTGMYRPVSATGLNAVRVIALLIPLSYLGACALGVVGVFWGRLATDLAVGILGIAWVAHALGPADRAKAAPSVRA